MISIPPLRDYIDGAWPAPSVPIEGWLEDPNTGERVGPMLATPPENVEAALAAAARAHEAGKWSGTPAEERAAVLEAIADRLERRMDEIAQIESAQTGVVIGMNKMLSIIVPGSFRLAADQLRTGGTLTVFPGDVEAHSLPWGPAVCLVPWNAPAPMAAHKAANAIAAGCPVILKPSEFAPASCTVIAEECSDAGLPPGVFQLVHGGPTVGGSLVQDRRTRAVSFTGGLAAGRAIAAACAQDFKPAQLELGGNNPVVVMEDADPDTAAAGIVALLTSLNGQWCRALGRLIVPQALGTVVMKAVESRLASLRLGGSLDETSEMGPIVHSIHVQRLRNRVAELERAGGTVHAPTPIPERGNFYAPTLIDGVSGENAIDEIFGPVATVHTYSSEDEALSLANGTPFGLEGYVFGADEERALAVARRIHAGEVKVNGASVISLHLMAPRPAWGLSGFAAEGTVETFRFFCGSRVVGVERSP